MHNAHIYTQDVNVALGVPISLTANVYMEFLTVVNCHVCVSEYKCEVDRLLLPHRTKDTRQDEGRGAWVKGVEGIESRRRKCFRYSIIA